MSEFKCTFNMRIEDMTPKGLLSNKGFLEYMENCAERHSASEGFGLRDINKTGASWVLVDWRLEVLERPVYGSQITVTTWVRKMDSYYSYRDFEVYHNDTLIGRATSKWILIDIKEGTVKHMDDTYKNLFGIVDDKKVFEEGFTRLDVFDEYDNSVNVDIRKSDIDLNYHVHNLIYLDYLKESLTVSENKEYSNLRIIYKKAIKFDDHITVSKKLDNGVYCFVIKNENGDTLSIAQMN